MIEREKERESEWRNEYERARKGERVCVSESGRVSKWVRYRETKLFYMSRRAMYWIVLVERTNFFHYYYYFCCCSCVVVAVVAAAASVRNQMRSITVTWQVPNLISIKFDKFLIWFFFCSGFVWWYFFLKFIICFNYFCKKIKKKSQINVEVCVFLWWILRIWSHLIVQFFCKSNLM